MKTPPASTLLCIPIVVGGVVMLLAGAPASRWATHFSVGVLGVMVYFAVVRGPRVSWSVLVAGAALAFGAIAATLWGASIDGMHRWLVVSSFRIHPSALLSPAALMLAAAYLPSRPTLVQALLVGIQAVHVLQPDAGQATCFALAATVLLLGAAPTVAARTCAVLLLAGVTVAWLRPDPLPPAPFVEDILSRAFGVTPWLGGLALLSLVPALCAPRLAQSARSSATSRSAEVALTVYLAASLLVVTYGEFPIALLGYGPSPAIGAFLGLAAFQRLCRNAVATGEPRRPGGAPELPPTLLSPFAMLRST
jgi:cell division protein FtsW (lipid II flippase)